MTEHFSPIKGTCKNPAGCTSFLVGLYGAWPDAQRIVERLQLSRSRDPIHLYQHELHGLILGPWEQSISAYTDQLGISILEAVLGDGTNPDSAMAKYHRAIEYATEVRHKPLIVPAYFRLVELMTRQGRTNDALRLIEEFESRYKGKIPEPFAPTENEFNLMLTKKSRLKSSARMASPVGTT
jgi:hypothetical protein